MPEDESTDRLDVIGELARQVLTNDHDPWSWNVQLAQKHGDLDEDTVRQHVTNRCTTLRPRLDEGAIAPEQVFKALAGIPPTLAIPDASLTDRELAHHTWRYVAQQPEYHVRDEDESLWVYDDGIWVQEGVQTLRTVACDLLATAYGQNIRTELVERVRGDPTVRLEPDAFGVPTGMVAIENGLLDLDAAADGAGADARRDLRPDDYALTRLPVAHDPDAYYVLAVRFLPGWVDPENPEPFHAVDQSLAPSPGLFALYPDEVCRGERTNRFRCEIEESRSRAGGRARGAGRLTRCGLRVLLRVRGDLPHGGHPRTAGGK